MRVEDLDLGDAPAQTALLALNNAHAEATSYLTADRWRALQGTAFAATQVRPSAGLLIAMARDAAYDSPNFLWFRARYDRFAYVDRVIVDQAHQGRGIARALYDDLAERARGAGLERIVCEVNRIPPNPGSDAFHARLGFSEVGAGVLAQDKAVRYLAKELGA
ncbi:MAG: GNAT family N-acetyltransferase [Pseudomonadota bacterium]